ncbi:MAG: hypothetical protein ACTSW0_10925 [Candidatus Heimdallarchaeota archaeon]
MGFKITIEEFETSHLIEQFYNALRGFIVLEESGLPKYIEFLTEEQFDVILLAGLLSSLQSLAEVISEENIKTIETTNSIFLFEFRDNFFYIFWVEKITPNIDSYQVVINKLIARFIGAQKINMDNTLLISNLTETPDFEKLGQRIIKFRAMDMQLSNAYKKIMDESNASEEVRQLTKKLAGIDGVLIIDESGKLEYSEFSRGKPLFNLQILTNFLVGLRKSIKNLDPGDLEEVTTQNYRFIVYNSDGYFYVFEVIKGLAVDEDLKNIQQKIISRYEGVRNKNLPFKLLQGLDTVPEYELLGRLKLEMKERQKHFSSQQSLQRQTSRLSFGDSVNKWAREEAQMHTFMAIYPDVILTGIVTPSRRFFTMKRIADSNDWIDLAKNLELSKLLDLIPATQHTLKKIPQKGKLLLLSPLTSQSVLVAIVEKTSAELEQYMLRLPLILRKISSNLL